MYRVVIALSVKHVQKHAMTRRWKDSKRLEDKKKHKKNMENVGHARNEK